MEGRLKKNGDLSTKDYQKVPPKKGKLLDLGRNFLKSFSITLSTVFLLAPAALAQELSPWEKFGGTLGAAVEVGRLGNSGMSLDDRTLSSISLEALGGYRYDSKWLFGLDLNYRIQQQLTSTSDAGGTNMKGKGWLLGLGVQYRFNELWALQGAVDFLGQYNFDKQTAGGEDDHVHAPLSLRLKGQYFFLPRWTMDASASYIRWSKFHVAGVDHSETSMQWMIGAGLTYHFGSEASFSRKEVTPANQAAPVTTANTASNADSQREEIAQILETEKIADGFKVKLPSDAFASSKAEMNPEFAAKIREIGAVLGKNQNQKVTVKGHTDSSGRKTSNSKLSQDRAENVKSALVQGGVSESQVQAIGVGSKEPLVDNKTPEGRAQNRRVEILVTP